jgi:Holliday junction resolvase
MEKLSNKEIEKKAVEWVQAYLKKQGIASREGERGVDVIAGEGSNEQYIEVKGCAKRETNLRIAQQALKYIREHDKLKQGSFFIYYVFDLATENPKLMIFDYNTYDQKKFEETKILIQPFAIRRELKKPGIIELGNLT